MREGGGGGALGLSQVPLKTLVWFVPATVYFQLQAPPHAASVAAGAAALAAAPLSRGSPVQRSTAAHSASPVTEAPQEAQLAHPRVRTGPAGVALEHAASMSSEGQQGARRTCPNSGTLRKQKRESRRSHSAALQQQLPSRRTSMTRCRLLACLRLGQRVQRAAGPAHALSRMACKAAHGMRAAAPAMAGHPDMLTSTARRRRT